MRLIFFILLVASLLSSSAYRLIRQPHAFNLRHRWLHAQQQPAEANGQSDMDRETLPKYALVLGVLPALSYVTLPYLLQHVTDFDLSATERQPFIIALLLSKRLFLYYTAITTVELCAIRALQTKGGVGQRLNTVNSDLFAGLGVTIGERSREEKIASTQTELSALEQRLENEGPEASVAIAQKNVLRARLASLQQATEDNKSAYNALDDISDKDLSIAIPLLLTGSLSVSYFFVTRTASPIYFHAAVVSPDMINGIKQLLRLISGASAASVCFLFTKSELQNAFKSQLGGTVTAIILVLLAYLHIPLQGLSDGSWVAQNIVNVCIVVTISRVAQIRELKWILAALLGVTLYDVLGVFGSQQLTDGGASIMEAVARARVDFLPQSTTVRSELLDSLRINTWQPGLLQMWVGGRISDLLGLGDILFPAILAAWSKEADEMCRLERIEKENMRPLEKKSRFKLSLWNEDSDATKTDRHIYRAAIFGYAVGCILCEVFQTGGGQPALLFIVPAMAVTLGLEYLSSTKSLFRSNEN